VPDVDVPEGADNVGIAGEFLTLAVSVDQVMFVR
jgi:hypothetical protein